MRTQLPDDRLDTLRSHLEALAKDAMVEIQLEAQAEGIHLKERHGRAANGYYFAASALLNSQGILHNEFIDRPEWKAMRAISRRYNS